MCYSEPSTTDGSRSKTDPFFEYSILFSKKARREKTEIRKEITPSGRVTVSLGASNTLGSCRLYVLA